MIIVAQMCDYCSWIEKIVRPKIEDLPTVCTNILNDVRETEVEEIIPVKRDPIILVHGTADLTSTEEENKAMLENIERAAIEGYKELAKGCRAVEAVEIAVRRLENVETNLKNGDGIDGFGSNVSSVIRDAVIMDSDGNAGAVGAVVDAIHPITLAKNVLQKTDHCLIVEDGIRNLDSFSNVSSHTDVSLDEILSTPPNSRNSEENFVDDEKKINRTDLYKGVRLCGAVARDRKGLLACGNSTRDDRPESVERSSITASGTIVGCGIFANEKFCCSVSGEDRAVYLNAPARKIVERLEREFGTEKDSETSLRIEDSMNDELLNFSEDTGSTCIGNAVLSLEGESEVAFTSQYFPWARCENGVVTSGYKKGEVFEKDVGELDMPLDCRCD